VHHPFFDKLGGRVIFLEGTYSLTYSGNRHPTPRYDCNQIMYKLDLDDPRVNLPGAVYDLSDGSRNRFSKHGTAGQEVTAGQIAFWALQRPASQALPVYQLQTPQGTFRLAAGGGSERSQPTADRPVFFVLAADMASPPDVTVPLYEFRRETDGLCAYATAAEESSLSGYCRQPKPIGLVTETDALTYVSPPRWQAETSPSIRQG
jgi:hypothetical protein